MSASSIRPPHTAVVAGDPWLVGSRSFLRPDAPRGGGTITFDDGTHAIARREQARPDAAGRVKASA